MSTPLRSDPESGLSLVDLLLEEQADLSAVERFALREVKSDASTSLYESSMPSSRPGSGEQYAFRVDLDACTGCKACVTACHSLNGLDDGETWRKVGLLVGVDDGAPVQQTVTGACHHCEDPGCMSGCPVRAYEKDEETGIVRHLDDQCIGCKYCTLMCPYDVPQYNERLGIVRKCDMCTGRLEEGEAPACVQGCPNGAISIAVVPVRGAGERFELLLSPARELTSASTTRPTTRYLSSLSSRDDASTLSLRASDREVVASNHAHWPLAVLLVCAQLSVGLVGVDVVTRTLGVRGAPTAGWLGMALAAALLGQGAAFLHVGRPLYAFRAVLGLGTSWMSREIVALGAYVGLLSLHFAVAVLGSLLAPQLLARLPIGAGPTGVAALAVGALGIGTSVMLYAVTGRPYWSRGRTALRFASTAWILGTGVGAAAALVAGASVSLCVFLAVAGALVAGAKLELEHRRRSADRGSAIAALVRSARLETAMLTDRVRARALLLVAAWISLGLAMLLGPVGLRPALVFALAASGGLAAVAAELCERHLFFVAEASQGMPGA